MKLSDISELHLAAIVAGATLVGGFLSSIANVYFLDAKTEKETDVKILELAIGILSEPIEPEKSLSSSDQALRSWAFDTMNFVSEIKFSEDVRASLVQGTTILGPFITGYGININKSKSLEDISTENEERTTKLIEEALRSFSNRFPEPKSETPLQQPEEEYPGDNKP